MRRSVGLFTLGVLVLGLCIPCLVWAKGIAVDLDAAQIEVGQQVRLTLTYDPKEGQGTPDLSELQRDFAILGTERAMSYTMMNGQARSIAQWGIVLEPKHTGLITIPSLRIGALTSAPVQLNVSPTSHASAKQAANQSMPEVDLKDAMALNVAVDNTNPYLNQEILYKVSLVTRHRLLDVRYQEPQVDDAILFPIGDSQQYQTTRDGVVYQVDEQIYAIFPQKSGPLHITPPKLRALRFDNPPQPVTLTGDAVTVQVQPLPKHYARREWLPSKLVRLRETYDQPDTQLVEGATVVRTIELQAQGLVAQLLPEIPFADSADLRMYPAPAERDTRIQQGELWGRAKVKITYVFPKPGMVALPAIRVPWFNVKTQKTEIAELPAKPYNIRSVSPKTKAKPVMPKPKIQAAVVYPNMPAAPAWSWELKPRAVAWAALLIMALGLVFVIVRWRLQAAKPLRALRAACRANDVMRTKAALLGWGRQQWPDKDMTHFTEIFPLLHEQIALRAALQAFCAALYHPTSTTNWQGAELWRAVQAFKQQPASKRTRVSHVPPIYPPRK